MNAIEYAQKASKLFAVPETALKIKKLTDSGTADLSEITRVVEKDPGLAAHVLKLANSSVYRFSRKVEDLDRAMQVIGTNSVYEFALAFAVSDAMGREQKKFIDVYKYWAQSLTCAYICRSLAGITGERDVSRLFMAGLFHNIGELAVLRINPSIARDCNRFSEDVYPKQVQKNLLGFSFAEVSASLLQKWLLPDSIVSTVAMQHHEEQAAILQEVQILQLAYKLSMISTYEHMYSIYRDVPEFLYKSLNLDAVKVREVSVESVQLTKDTIHLFTS